MTEQPFIAKTEPKRLSNLVIFSDEFVEVKRKVKEFFDALKDKNVKIENGTTQALKISNPGEYLQIIYTTTIIYSHDAFE